MIVRNKGLLVTLAFVSLVFFCIYVFIRSSREKAFKIICTNNLRQIGIGLIQYEVDHGTLPIGIELDAKGRKWRSWRSCIYPVYIEQAQNFYDSKYPWDAEINKRLIDRTALPIRTKGQVEPTFHSIKPLPDFWVCPCCDPKNMKGVSYVVVTGEETAFPVNHAVKFSEITDGLENTILVVESLNCNPIWTEPKDLQFSEMSFKVGSTDLPCLSSKHRGGVNVVFADGLSFFITNKISEADLKALFTIAGGESVTRDELIRKGVIKKS